jgi:non-specific serine/threonine protein kinase
MAWQQGDYAAARDLLEESAALYRQLGDRRSLVRVLNPLSRALLFQGEHARARMLLEECTALSREVGDHSQLAMSLLGRASLAMDQADYAAARALLEQSLSIYRTLGEPWGIGLTLNYLGDVARCEGDYEQAATHYQESLTLFRTQGIQVEIAAILHNLGYAVLAMGDQRHARTCFAESLALHREQDNRPGVLESLAGFGALMVAQGQPRRAAILFGAIAALRAALNVPMWPAERVEYERHVAATRAQLDEATFAVAWAEGRALTLEQAIVEALAVSPEAHPTQQDIGPTDPAPQQAGAAPDRLGTLTPRERQVLALIAQGYSNRAIADTLVIAERTAEIHVSNILSKLGVTSRTQAAAYALAHGLAAPSHT